MPYIYSSKSQWPLIKDTWPTLYNQGQVNESEATLVYAEHYNKLKDFVVKAQKLYSNSRLSSDGTIDRLGLKLSISFPFKSLYQHIIQSNSPLSWPGNLFEFDVVLANDVSTYFKTYTLANPNLSLVLDASPYTDFDITTDAVLPSLCLSPSAAVENIPLTNLAKIQSQFNTAPFSCAVNGVQYASGYEALVFNCSILSHRASDIFTSTAPPSNLTINLNLLFLK